MSGLHNSVTSGPISKTTLPTFIMCYDSECLSQQLGVLRNLFIIHLF